MTKLVQGKIEKIVSKPIPADKFDNVFRLSVKVGEDWVGLGSVKKEGLQINKGKEWIDLKQGDEVVITAEENGDFLNAKRSDVKLIKAAIATPGSPLPPKKPTAAVAQSSSTFVDRDLEIKAGMFFNKAVDVAIAKHGEKVSKGTVVQAYQMLEEAYAECRSAKKAPEPRDVAPDENPDDGVDFDSEIPF